jgi:carotenoid cleavage dioxygenase-like enzyme
MTTGEITRKVLDKQDLLLEFPIVNLEFVGHKSRYCYMTCREKSDKIPETQEERDNFSHTGFIKYDVQEEKVVGKVSFGETHTGDEVFYHQRDGFYPVKKEDDGYLMTTIYNWKTNQSEFAMWDAKTLEPVV